MGVFFLFFQVPLFFKVQQYLLAALGAVHALVARAGKHGHAPVVAYYGYHRQRRALALGNGLVVKVVPRRDLKRAGAKLRVHARVGNNRYLTARQRKLQQFSYVLAVAFVTRVNGHGRISQHGLRPGGGHGQRASAIKQRVVYVGQRALALFVLHLYVRERGLAPGAPVDEPCGAVYKAFLVETYKDLPYGAREALVQGKALARPVGRDAYFLKLVYYPVAVLLFPLPDSIDKRIAADRVAVGAFLRQGPFYYVLRCDARMVGARHPERPSAGHACPTYKDVLQRGVKGVAHVQRAGDVWRRDDDGEGFAAGVYLGAKIPLLGP